MHRRAPGWSRSPSGSSCGRSSGCAHTSATAHAQRGAGRPDRRIDSRVRLDQPDPGRRERRYPGWTRPVAGSADAAFDALLQEVGVALEADPTLGGLAFGLTYRRPEPRDRGYHRCAGDQERNAHGDSRLRSGSASGLDCASLLCSTSAAFGPDPVDLASEVRGVDVPQAPKRVHDSQKAEGCDDQPHALANLLLFPPGGDFRGP